MIAALTFDSAGVRDGGRSVRRATFAPRSTLPLSAACLVANGVRETLGRLLARELDVELIEPAMPRGAQRRTLVEGATISRVRGRLCDGFVIVRPSDARRIVALAFGEHEGPGDAALSEIERTTVDRVVAACVPLCNALCGTLGPVVRESSERAASDLETYFEIRTAGRTPVAIGFALTRDPAEAIGTTLTVEDLADVELEGRVELGSGELGVPAFSRLTTGATVPLETSLGSSGVLRFGDVVFARGTCGIREERRVIAIVPGDATAPGRGERGR